MGVLGQEDKYYFSEFAKYQLKSSVAWMRLITVVAFFATAALYFFAFEFVRHEFFRSFGPREEDFLVLTIFIIACGMLTAICFFLNATSRAFSDFLKDGSPITLQQALTRKKVLLILVGVLGLLVSIGILFILYQYLYWTFFRRW